MSDKTLYRTLHKDLAGELQALYALSGHDVLIRSTADMLKTPYMKRRSAAERSKFKEGADWFFVGTDLTGRYEIRGIAGHQSWLAITAKRVDQLLSSGPNGAGLAVCTGDAVFILAPNNFKAMVAEMSAVKECGPVTYKGLTHCFTRSLLREHARWILEWPESRRAGFRPMLARLSK